MTVGRSGVYTLRGPVGLAQDLGGLKEAGRSQWGPCSQPSEELQLAQALDLDRLNYGVLGLKCRSRGDLRSICVGPCLMSPCHLLVVHAQKYKPMF